MTWVKIDDKFYDNPTNRALGPAGRDLFIAGLTYCAKGLTDGAIPKVDLPLLLAQAQAKRSTVEKLLEAGRWLDLGDRFEVAEYLTYQLSKERVLADRERARKKKQRQRAGGDDDEDDFESVPPDVPPGSPPGDTQGDTPRGVPALPSRPVPSTDVSPPGSVLVNGDREAAFAAFWKAYPRKVAKGAARAAFGKALKKVDPQVLIAAAGAYATDPQRKPDYTKHPATWLNAECWEDQPDLERRHAKGVIAAQRLAARAGAMELNP